jgi:hypothetical protein
MPEIIERLKARSGKMRMRMGAMALTALVFVAVVAFPRPGRCAAIADVIDWNSVKDEHAREAARIINDKLLLADEIKCKMQIGDYMPDGKCAGIRDDSLSARRSGEVFVKSIQTESAIPTTKGMVSYTIIDGKTWWKHQQTAPGSGKALVESMKNHGMKQADIQTAIAQHRKPILAKCDLAKLKEAGFSPNYLLNFTNPLTPFVNCDLTTLKIENEEADSWIFSAQPNPSLPFQSAGMTFVAAAYKDNGILKYAEYASPGLMVTKQSVTDVIVAPNPPLQDSLFTFKSPPGLVAEDQTDLAVKAFQRMQAER